MVRLRGNILAIALTSCSGFNSKMVRLRAITRYIEPSAACTFQFQNGAIKSEFSFTFIAPPVEFQFQNGAIKRLRVIAKVIRSLGFQFQNGAIKSIL